MNMKKNIIKNLITLIITSIVCLMMVMAVRNINHSVKKIEQLYECQYQIEHYPTLKNIEVQTARIDSILNN